MPARLLSDIYRHIRRVKGGRWQARPYDLGVRYNLGLFATEGEARRALDEFWWGKRQEVPRYTRRVNARSGVYFTALVPNPFGDPIPMGPFKTREAAADAVAETVKNLWGEAAADVLRGQVPRVRVVLGQPAAAG